MIASLLRRKDALAGLFFAGVGLAFAMLSRDYAFGTSLDLGHGFFPRILAMLLAGLGLLLFLKSFASVSDEAIHIEWRPIFFVLASLVVFSLLLDDYGLVAAMAGLMLCSAFASPDPRVIELALLYVFLTALIGLTFAVGLDLPLPIWPR